MFKITIEEIKTVKRMTRGDWVTIEERPFTKKELEEIGYHGTEPSFDRMKEVRGYAPDREMLHEERIQTFQQTVETLNLPSVIKAINGI